MTRLLVVRHGQSEWNALGRWQGHADPPLSALGRRQARAAAGAIGTVDVIVASDLQRAGETAAIIAEEIGVGPVVVDERLRERHVGAWEGLTRAEIEEGWPGWLADGRRPGDFESDEEVATRVLVAIDEIHAAWTGADVLLVAHGGVVRTLERHHGEEGHPVPNLGARRLLHRGDRLELLERVELVAHDTP